jgi:hypothetical protein
VEIGIASVVACQLILVEISAQALETPPTSVGFLTYGSLW